MTGKRARKSAPPDAMTVALRLLARRGRSEAEIRAALAGRGTPAAEIRRVLGRLRHLGYIDDRKLAAECAERLQERGFGSLRIRDQLQRLGIEEGLAANVIPAAREERVVAKRLIETRFGRTLTDPRRRAEAWRWLAGRGFPEAVLESLIDPSPE